MIYFQIILVNVFFMKVNGKSFGGRSRGGRQKRCLFMHCQFRAFRLFINCFVERQHPKYTFKCILYWPLSVCVCIFQIRFKGRLTLLKMSFFLLHALSQKGRSFTSVSFISISERSLFIPIICLIFVLLYVFFLLQYFNQSTGDIWWYLVVNYLLYPIHQGCLALSC